MPKLYKEKGRQEREKQEILIFSSRYNFLPTYTDPTQLPSATSSQLTTTASPTLPSYSAHGDDVPIAQVNISKIENAAAYPLAERSLQVLAELFNREDTSDTIRAAVYGDIAKVVGAAMMTKYSRYLLWLFTP